MSWNSTKIIRKSQWVTKCFTIIAFVVLHQQVISLGIISTRKGQCKLKLLVMYHVRWREEKCQVILNCILFQRVELEWPLQKFRLHSSQHRSFVCALMTTTTSTNILLQIRRKEKPKKKLFSLYDVINSNLKCVRRFLQPLYSMRKVNFVSTEIASSVWHKRFWAVVATQLTARSLPIPEDPGSKPVLGNIY